MRGDGGGARKGHQRPVWVNHRRGDGFKVGEEYWVLVCSARGRVNGRGVSGGTIAGGSSAGGWGAAGGDQGSRVAGGAQVGAGSGGCWEALGGGSKTVLGLKQGERPRESGKKTLYIIYLPTPTACLPPIHKAPVVPQIHTVPCSSCVEPTGFPQTLKTKTN